MAVSKAVVLRWWWHLGALATGLLPPPPPRDLPLLRLPAPSAVFFSFLKSGFLCVTTQWKLAIPLHFKSHFIIFSCLSYLTHIIACFLTASVFQDEGYEFNQIPSRIPGVLSFFRYKLFNYIYVLEPLETV